MSTTGLIDLPTLSRLVAEDQIDTVVVAFVDLQGRLMGKRVTGRFFLDHVAGDGTMEGEGIEACNYLLAVDVDMNVIDGFRYATWDGGYGDFRGRPDLSTLRVTPWLEKTALVLCDIVDHHGGPVAVSPRQVLQHQLDRGSGAGAHRQAGLGAGVLRLRPPLRRPGAGAVPHARRAHVVLVQPRLPRVPDHQGRTAHPCHPQRHGRRRAPGGVLQGRGRPGPARAQPPLRGRADDGGQPHHLQERREGDRPPAGQGAHVHGEALDRPARLQLPHPLLDLVARRRPPAVPRRGRPDRR